MKILYRSTVMVLSCLVFLFVVTAAKAEETAGRDVLEIYQSMNSIMSIWMPILITVVSGLFLLRENS